MRNLHSFYDHGPSLLTTVIQPTEQPQTRFDIVGIGVSVWDNVLLLDSYPDPGSVVQATQRVDGIGGGISVATATAARLGSRTALVDCLGDDAASNWIIQSLQREGVDTTTVRRRFGETSSTASIWTDSAASERTIVFFPGSASGMLEWTPEIEHAVRSTKILHLNGRHPAVCSRAIRTAKSMGVAISFDGGAYRYRDEILPMLRSSDLVIVAKQFADSHYTRHSDSTTAIATMGLAEFLMKDLACEIVGVTDGANGSYWVNRDGECFHQTALTPDLAVDTTGCGDTFHGGFLHAYAAGQDLRSAAEFAAGVASKNARSMGALAF